MTSWLLANSDKVNLRVSQFNWVDDWITGCFDFAVQLTVRGHLFEGRGTSEVEDLAFAKAAGEALERVAMASVDAPSSSGFALHPDKQQAIALASEELIERDAYFCHWLTNTPFASVNLDLCRGYKIGKKSVADVESRLKSMGVDVIYAHMKTANGSVAVLCTAFGIAASRPFGLVQGFGGGPCVRDAVAKATIECLRTVIAWDRGTYQGGHPLTLQQMKEIPHPGPLEHERYGLCVDSAALLRPYLEAADFEPRDAASDPIIHYEEIRLPESIADAPVVVVRATSHDLQDAIFGHIQPSSLNLERLSNFCGRVVSVKDVRFDPHCFG